MGSFLKYFSLFRIAMALLQEGLAWHEKATEEGSPGGEDITGAEYTELIPIIEKAILEGLGAAVRVKVEPK